MAIKHGEPEVEETRTKVGRISKTTYAIPLCAMHKNNMFSILRNENVTAE